MNDFAFKKSTVLTKNDIDNLLRQFGGKNQGYIEIVDVEKNRQTIDKYPLIKDIALSIKDTQQDKLFNKSTY
ncbi:MULTISPECIES: BcsR/BcsP family cellulose biosynthesis protein [Pseudoalteromonas]|jgi:hypothetical protein|uniref:Uncharacterized protein n=1 Tax=Pseudoalteromonas lipolytica TaxID=570156 RepID=A0AAD0S1H8_9GAMM|nr:MULTISPECIES: BcsR/BcsP family cellulose biosynthesis protein [Pseudoalteromonas]AXV65789.1 hypothetical protein D0907_11200 [Pseudoalteromonas donghaensis]EWH07760.1 hypothetical protein AT00_02330 [Pseudoalteromonas lipolytica SCSIO 04301]MAE02517.1 hypothetical protein [Pseudoalteromonas sp.]MCC9659385.1 hypothetical protein [Pseudoalteromonas sp. MB41]QLJ07348.1 hypothetical protein GZH31_11160 [Pseudoalteromonas sp. JSTW]|tara:strand:+ start:2085 stop:2300 length:216 start_codon:yes stop_codon:yes gene_type:complete